MAGKIKLNAGELEKLDPALREAIQQRIRGIGTSRKHSMSKEQTKGHALSILAHISHLSTRDRKRVLEFALRLNQL